jgi:hypothetical protein
MRRAAAAAAAAACRPSGGHRYVGAVLRKGGGGERGDEGRWDGDICKGEAAISSRHRISCFVGPELGGGLEGTERRRNGV